MPKKTDKDILKRKLIEALRKTLGVIAPACRLCECSRQTFYDFCKEDTDFKQQFEDIKEEAIDFAEQQLFKNINDQKEASIFFYLKTQAKHRGYIEKQEIEQTGNMTHEFTGFSFLKPIAKKPDDE